MIDVRSFVSALSKGGVHFCSGVPDSLLAHFCSYACTALSSDQHVIASNEGTAIALAIGHHLATGGTPLVYLQNSGIGNTVGALTSLTHTDIYGIPIVLLIGWRGEIRDGTQLKDEPQHIKQGRSTLQQLELLDIPYFILDASMHGDIDQFTQSVVAMAVRLQAPVAIVVRKGTFAPLSIKKPALTNSRAELKREEIIECCVEELDADVPVICTTGMASRELYEIRERRGLSHRFDFLTVGGMGLASSIALGVALGLPEKWVCCIDGDGALLMHMGAMPYCARARNIIHLVINNGSHDSVGGQPTLAADLNLSRIARVVGYSSCYRVKTIQELISAFGERPRKRGSVFIEALCVPGARAELGRPKEHPRENKQAFANFVRQRLSDGLAAAPACEHSGSTSLV